MVDQLRMDMPAVIVQRSSTFIPQMAPCSPLRTLSTFYGAYVQYQAIYKFNILIMMMGGITISKRRTCLKGDIVEALQCVKCAIRHDLLFREPAPSSTSEMEETSDQELENA